LPVWGSGREVAAFRTGNDDTFDNDDDSCNASDAACTTV
jgi:hypothetical protein